MQKMSLRASKQILALNDLTHCEIAMALCDGWETLPHDVTREEDLELVGTHTHLCPECLLKLSNDPAKDQLIPYL